MQIEITEEQAKQYNQLVNGAYALVRPHLLIDGEPQRGRPGWFTRRKLRRGIEGFKAALAIAPFKWECEFWIAKSLQRLGDHRESMTWFTEALRKQPENPIVAKEAANAAFEIGEFELGIALLRPASLAKPSDPVLHYDLAVHLLLSGRPKDAHGSLERAVSLEPHRDTKRLIAYVEDVLAGRVSCPRSAAELRRGL